ncbi:MAG: helix-turn-helix transcriptional regulator [Aeriscardovia sp.]|nr:helix-turn-helix transcriptional regulator [Aeriscardovia sp.]
MQVEPQLKASRCLINDICKSRSWTVEKLAEASCIPVQRISEIINGSPIKGQEIDQIAQALAVSTDDLFTAGDPRKTAAIRDKESQDHLLIIKKESIEKAEKKFWKTSIPTLLTVIMVCLLLFFTSLTTRLITLIAWGIMIIGFCIFYTQWLVPYIEKKYKTPTDNIK